MWTRKNVQTYQDVLVHGLNGVHALKIVKIADVDAPENVRENATDQINAWDLWFTQMFVKMRVSTVCDIKS